jgi:hypothetical protein
MINIKNGNFELFYCYGGAYHFVVRYLDSIIFKGGLLSYDDMIDCFDEIIGEYKMKGLE